MIARAGLLVLWMLAGCASPRKEPETSRPTAAGGLPRPTAGAQLPPGGPAPACNVTLAEDGRLLVNERSLPPPFDSGSGAALRVYPLSEDAVLLAARAPIEMLAVSGPASTLWRVACSGSAPVEPFVSFDRADFGWSAISVDGTTLYFSRGGIVALDLRTKQTTELTNPGVLPPPRPCWIETAPLSDLAVELLDPSTLLVYRGAGCGFESDWEARQVALDLRAGSGALVRPLHPIGAVAVDAKGTLWMGDGVTCQSPGVVDPAARGAVWRSTDDGESFERIELVKKGEYDGPPTPVAQIVVGETPDHVLVRTRVCSGGGIGLYGGSLFVTRDGGATWSKMTPPPERPVEGEGDLLGTVQAVGGSIRHVRVANTALAESAGTTGWETEDGGATWAALGTRKPSLDASGPRSARSARSTFRATRFGLVRERKGSNTEIVFPKH